MIHLTFYMEPVPKAAPRTTFGDGSVRTFNPDKTTQAMAFIKSTAISWANEKGVDLFPIYEARLPLLMSATFVKSRPKSLPKRITLPAVMPDLDNYCKLLLDALKGVIFDDDGQIVGMMLEKEFVQSGGMPRVEVSFWEALPPDQVLVQVGRRKTNVGK
jgi:Holliday junction resolvase RusA-like endonuclease